MSVGVNSENYNNEYEGNLNINFTSYLQHRVDRVVSDTISFMRRFSLMCRGWYIRYRPCILNDLLYCSKTKSRMLFFL